MDERDRSSIAGLRLSLGITRFAGYIEFVPGLAGATQLGAARIGVYEVNPGLIAGRNEFSLEESEGDDRPLRAKGLLPHLVAQRVKVDGGMLINKK